MCGRTAMFCVAVALAGTSIVEAQGPEARTDSLARVVRQLQSRIDSLEQMLARLMQQGQDVRPVQDELAALRAAAAEAAPPDTTGRPADERQFQSRARNLSQLNPEITATGDMRIRTERSAEWENNFELHEFEFSVQSSLDPFSSTKIFLGYEDGEFGIEEGYAYWTGLPGHLRLDLGRFRQQVGELNRWHLHALPESEYPLVLREYFGDDGLVGDGVSLYWLAPQTGTALGTHELWGQITLANNDVLFEDGRRLSFLGHFKNFWAVTAASFFQIGASAVFGTNPDAALATSVIGADLRLTWRPPERAQYRSFTLRAEGYAITKEVGGAGDTRYGGYAGVEYQLTRRLFAGARVDYVQHLAGGGAIWAVLPHLTWWQSEWVYFHAQWQHESTPTAGSRATGDRLLLQAVWSIGPHKHETY